MQTLIAFTSNSRAYIRWLEQGRPADSPRDVPFWLPTETKKGDRYLLFVGGADQIYVGQGRVDSNWRTGRSGGWKGVPLVETSSELMFTESIPGSDVFAVTGFGIPRRRQVVDAERAALVWKTARGKPLTRIDRAVEGIVTEARSKSRNAALRKAALARAGGVCQCCGRNYGRVADGLGAHCLVIHHKKQLKDTDAPTETKLAELAVVCANCHMMVHSDRDKALTITQVRTKLRVRRPDFTGS